MGQNGTQERGRPRRSRCISSEETAEIRRVFGVELVHDPNGSDVSHWHSSTTQFDGQNNTAKCSLHICLYMDFPTREIHRPNTPDLPCVDPPIILGRRDQFDVLTQIRDWLRRVR